MSDTDMNDSTGEAPTERTGRRGGGRSARKAARASASTGAAAFITRSLTPFDIVSTEGLELLEHNAETILEEVGVEIRDYPSAIERFRAAGAEVDGSRVRFPRGLCRSIVTATAPSLGTTAPPEIINFMPSAIDIFKGVMSVFGNISRKPLVGLGVVGTKMLTIASPVTACGSPFASLVRKPMT